MRSGAAAASTPRARPRSAERASDRYAGQSEASRVTMMPMASETTTVRVAKTVPVFGRSIPTAEKSASIPFASSRPRKSPTSDASTPITSDSSSTEQEHLLPRRADRAQRRQLARPLGDRDRERVHDHERADEEGDEPEREQELLQEREEGRRVARLVLGLLLAGSHLRRRRQDRADLREQLRRGLRCGLRHADLVELGPPCGTVAAPSAGRRSRSSRRRSRRRRRARRCPTMRNGRVGPCTDTPICWPTS